MGIQISLLEASDHIGWDAFVNDHQQGTFCHLVGWKTVIEQGAGQHCPYLVAKQDGEIVGVLPLTVKKHFLFGKALISNMFCVYGGALTADETVAVTLYEHAWSFAQDHQLPVLELRADVPEAVKDASWDTATGSATFNRQLAATDDEQLLMIPRKQRAVVRKSLKNNLSTNWVGDTDTFYDLYARSVLALGTPVFPKKLFAALASVFGDAVQVQLTLGPDGRPVASLMSFYFNQTVMPYYAGGSAFVRPLGAHDFMYYNLMLHARERGCSIFDFGRSKVDSGPYKFKKNWGFEPTPLHYCSRIAPGAAQPNLSQQAGPFATLSKVWKKLPLGVSKILGPPLARHLG